ncbi:hypothetical protein ABEF95_007866 [Exophiala dermatitidis]
MWKPDFNMSRSTNSLSIAQQLRKTTQLGLDDSSKKQPGNNYTSKVKIGQKYNIIGFISSGTYGRVYKAVEKNPRSDPSSPVGASAPKELYAIKKQVPVPFNFRNTRWA